MPGSCPYIKLNGEPCGRPVGSFKLCGHHRERPASKPSRPCAGCGALTKREGGLCIRRTCGWNEYVRTWNARKRAAAALEHAQESRREAAQDDRDRLAAAAFEELAAALDDTTGATPWPEWVGMARDDFETRGDLESLEAERQRQDAAAALVAALQVAETEAAAAAERDRAAREQLDRLRRAYAGTLCGSSAVRSGAASPRNVTPAC